MTPRQILATNLNRLMQAHGYTSNLKLVELSNGRLSNGKLGRIRKADGATDIDTLAELSAVFDLAPWQLMVEGLDPESLPALHDPKLLAQIQALVANVKVVPDTSESKFQIPDEGLPSDFVTTPERMVTNEAKLSPGSVVAKALARTKGEEDEVDSHAALQKPRARRRA